MERRERLRAKPKIEGSLWPAPYDEDSLDAALAFTFDCCRTWNEANLQVESIPAKPHLETIGNEWFNAKDAGGELYIEKGRRILVSWFVRCLELHQLGLGRKDWMLGGDGYAPACKHIWRLEHIYNDLKDQYQAWKLPESSTLSFEGERSLKWFGLANGSQVQAINGQGSKIQGEGVFGVTLEEASLYPYLASMVGQAHIVTEGAPGTKGGFVVLIANPELTHSWQVLKAGGRDMAGALGV